MWGGAEQKNARKMVQNDVEVAVQRLPRPAPGPQAAKQLGFLALRTPKSRSARHDAFTYRAGPVSRQVQPEPSPGAFPGLHCP